MSCRDEASLGGVQQRTEICFSRVHEKTTTMAMTQRGFFLVVYEENEKTFN
jgi:hypothetical protein